MPFAQLAATSTGNLASNTLTASLSIMGGVSSGDFLLAIVSTDGAPVITWDQSAAGTWTENQTRANGTNNKLTSWWKIADGTESDKQLKVYFDGVEQYAYHISRWTGVYSAGAPIESSVTITTTVSCTCPSITPSSGSLSYVFVAFIGYDNGTVTISTYPTSYVNTGNVRANATTGAGLGFGTINLAGTVQAQKQYVLTAAEQAVTVHASIRPAPPVTDQTISAGLVASGLTFYTQSLTMRLNINVPHVSPGLTFYTPTIQAGDRTVDVGLVASGLTIYTPTIQTTAQSINLNLVASGLTHYAPSFSMRREIDAGLVASGLSFFTQALAMRREVDVGLIGSTVTHYAPSIAGSLDINLGFSDYAVTFYPLTMYNPPIVTVKLRAVTLDLVELGTVQVINLNY